MEAGAGIEPANVGFANRCLTTWPSRLFNSACSGIIGNPEARWI